MTTSFFPVKLGQWIECYEKNCVIKDFYLRTLNPDNLKVGYSLTYGGGQYGYHVIGETHSVQYDRRTEMYKLLFYTRISYDSPSIPKMFENCLVLNILQWMQPSIRCGLCCDVPQPNEEIWIEYYDASEWTRPTTVVKAFVTSHDTKLYNTIVLDPNGGAGALYSEGRLTSDEPQYDYSSIH